MVRPDELSDLMGAGLRRPMAWTDLEGRGMTRGQLRALVKGGWVRRVTRGVYVAALAPDDVETKAAALRLVLPARAVASHGTAAWFMGVEALPDQDFVECSVPRGMDVAPRPGLRCYARALPACDVMALGRVPVTVPPRMVVDVAKARPLGDGVALMDAALRARILVEAHVHSRVSADAGLRGVVRARQVVRLADGRAESPMESRLRVLLVTSGLSAPEVQYVVRDVAGRFVGRVDLAYPAARVVIEYDGRDAHLEPGAFAKERRRQNELIQLGYVVLRYTAADVFSQPDRIVADVRNALSRRGN